MRFRRIDHLAAQLNTIDIVNGELSAATSMPIPLISWMVFDAAIRFQAGQPVDISVYNDGAALQLMNSENVGTPEPTKNLPAGYRDQFKKLCLVAVMTRADPGRCS